MREITTEESKEIQKGLLSEIHDFCEANNLTYFLMFGTLIGAIRHKGFIPWDDDIDIVMPRKDYEEFCSTFKSDHAKMINCVLDPDYYLPIGKVVDTRTVLKENVRSKTEIGVYIDIFVLDDLSGDDRINKKAIKKLLLLRDIIMLNLLPNSNKRKGLRKIAHKVLSLFTKKLNMNAVCRRMDSVAKKVNPNGKNVTSRGILMHISAKGLQRKYKYSLFSERILVGFENKQFWAPKEYDTILRDIYGDYMQFPPEDKRISHHEYEQYWKN